MGWLEIVLLAIGLSMDAFAVTIAAVASGKARGPRAVFRLAFHFGLFQFIMPVIGWFLGMTVISYVAAIDHWIALVLLSFVGGRMILESWSKEEEHFPADPSRGWNLVALAVATSIDALAVGLSLAMVHMAILGASAFIGCVTFAITLLGAGLGRKLGQLFGKRMELVGGLVLVGIGMKILVEHLNG